MNTLRDNASQHRFELDVEGGVAFANYRMAPGVVTITHTEVPAALRGRGLGGKLSRAVLEHIRAEGLQVIPRCGFFRGYIEAHPEFHDLRASN